MVTLSSTKEARIYNGKKTTSLTSGVGKTGQPLVKEGLFLLMRLQVKYKPWVSSFQKTNKQTCTLRKGNKN